MKKRYIAYKIVSFDFHLKNQNIIPHILFIASMNIFNRFLSKLCIITSSILLVQSHQTIIMNNNKRPRLTFDPFDQHEN